MQKQTQPKRALVLGGGAQVGRAWLAGLASKLIEDGVQLPIADLILGTSAGALVGAEIALRTLDLDKPPSAPAVYVDSQSPTMGVLAQLAPLMAQVVSASMPEIGLRKIGRLALETQTMSEEQAMQRVRSLAGHPWPKNFKATAVNVMSGERVLWDQDSAIPLAIGIASSGALPSAFPPVTIGADRYMDGAARSMLNADLAAGYDLVIVISCFSLDLSAVAPHTDQSILNAGLQSEINLLRRRGATVQVISPNADFLQLTKQGTEMLNLCLMPEAWQIGRRQALSEKKDIDRAWRLA